MPRQFSTEAANADVMGDDAQISGTPEGMPKAIGADGTPRGRAHRASEIEKTRAGAKADDTRAGGPRKSEAKPGEDIDAAGAAKDKDAPKP